VKDCAVKNIRNFMLAGHAGAGKTLLAELMLNKGGVTTRVGSVEQGTCVSDFRDEEKERQSSIYTTSLHCPWKDGHFFFTDTPGYADFCGEVIAAARAADMVVIVVDATAGIGTGTIRAWREARENNIPRAFFINGLDRDQASFANTLNALQNSYGATTCVPFTMPVGERANLSGVVNVLTATDVPAEVEGALATYREALMDTVAESDEELMMRYLDGEELSETEISEGLHAAIADGSVVPVFTGSVSKDIGVEELMDGIANLFPDPVKGRALAGEGGEIARGDADAAPVGLVFKSVQDPFIGQLNYIRIYSGTFRSDSEMVNLSSGKERFGSLLLPNGKEQETVATAGPGEIVAVAKLKQTGLGNTLGARAGGTAFAPIEFPQPTMSYAVYAVKSGEEEKISQGLSRLSEEDPTIRIERNQETKQMLVRGMGDQHLSNVVNRLKTMFKVEVDLRTPKVPYRETITATGSAQYRHKKQTGGHGQFAEVHLRLEPLADAEYEFDNEVSGGNIPRNFIPAVEKGVVEAMADGPMAGCRVINMKAIVYDGKHHAVDSSEMAFKIAARGAFRDAMANAKSILLEPIMRLRILFPEEYMGDVSGDLNSRRGRILGMEHEEGLQVVLAEVPMAETFSYSTQLRSITQGRGTFEMAFERYESVPSNLTQEIQAAAARAREEES